VNSATLTEHQAAAFATLERGPRSTVQVAKAIGRPVASTRDYLMALKQKGLVERLDAGQGTPTRWEKA
jgi:DNA-binding IclR family transcriptional regulator